MSDTESKGVSDRKQVASSNPHTGSVGWKRHLPMGLTWSRIAVCPLLVILLVLDNSSAQTTAAVVFVLASITDWFDGYFARKYNATSNMGKFMDPIADKVLVASALILLIPSGRVGPLVVLILLARDIFIGGIRSVAAADNVVIAAHLAGKWKTGLQMASIPALLLHEDSLPWPELHQFARGLLWTSVILSLISGYQYVRLYMQGRRQE